MSGLTGIENPMKIAILQELRMGGATIENVVLLIFDDANLKIDLGKESYQINGIVGYPVFQAFGTITFEKDDGLRVEKRRSETIGVLRCI